MIKYFVKKPSVKYGIFGIDGFTLEIEYASNRAATRYMKPMIRYKYFISTNPMLLEKIKINVMVSNPNKTAFLMRMDKVAFKVKF